MCTNMRRRWDVTICLATVLLVAIPSLAFANDFANIVSWGDRALPSGELAGITAIAAGSYHSLALRSDGSIAAWGGDQNGQATPLAGNDFIAIAVGGWHNLALRSDGSILGWGRAEYGQATPPAGNDFVALAAGYYHSLALRSDGSIVGWGCDQNGQATPPAGDDFVAIAAGYCHSLAQRSDGSIVGWGSRRYGQATPPAGNDFVAIAAGYYHSLALRSDGSIAAWGKDDYGQATPPAGNDFVAIAGGHGHSLALRSDGSIVGWGCDQNGQATPPAGNDFVAIAAGYCHSLALRSDGSIVGWGRDDYGQATPPAGNDFVAIAAGYYHSLALRSDGSIVGWGCDEYGQATPPAGNDFIAIAAGSSHSLALRADGSIVGWGRDDYGQATPPAGSNFVAIAAGYCHSLALRADGSTAGWGSNQNCQTTPPAGNDFVAIAAGYSHSLALSCANQPPVADAGQGQTVHPGTLATLDGSGSSDPDEDYPITYSWRMVSKPAGSLADLDNAETVSPSFVPDLPGDYTIELNVIDSLGAETVPDEGRGTVTISTSNTAPVADAGADQPLSILYTTVQLGMDPGRQSYDKDGDPFTFLWALTQQPEGSLATLDDPMSPTPSFVADVYGDYVIELVVTDCFEAVSDPDDVTVSFNNVEPVANPRDTQAVYLQDAVYLDGTGSSDVNEDPLTYSWSIVSKPEGSLAELQNSTSPTPTFMADMSGFYVVSLVVNDGQLDSDPSNVTIQAICTLDAVSQKLMVLLAAINSLDEGSLKNKNMKKPLTNKVNAVLGMVDKGLYSGALDKVESDILQKTNGCAEILQPDSNDWLITYEAQTQIYPLVTQVADLLRCLI